MPNAFSRDSGPTAHVAPVYPLLLAAIFRLCGTEAWWPVRLMAFTLTGLTAALMPALARRAGMRTGSGLVAAVVYALAPLFTVELDGAWEQPLAGLCLVILAFVSLDAIDHGWIRSRDAVRYGVIAGFTLLVSPSMLFVIALVPLQGLFQVGGRYGRLKLRSLVLMGAICGLCVGPWVIFNSWRMGGFVPIRSNFGLELNLGNRAEAEDALADWDNPEVPHPIMNGKERERVRQLGELAYMREKQQAATRWILQHPAKFFRLTAKRAFYFWFPTGFICVQSKPTIGMFLAANLRIMACLGFLGLISVWRLRSPYRWMWTILLLGPSVPYSITHVLIRYREPIQAIVLLLASEFVSIVLMALRQRCSAGRRTVTEGRPTVAETVGMN